MKRSLKDRILKFMIRLGKKSRILAYPITFLVVVFLGIYHAARKLIFDVQYHKLRTRILTGALAVFAVFFLTVLPSLADELTDADGNLILLEETAEPTETPNVTVEPIETEVPAEDATPEPVPTEVPEVVVEGGITEEGAGEDEQQKVADLPLVQNFSSEESAVFTTAVTPEPTATPRPVEKPSFVTDLNTDVEYWTYLEKGHTLQVIANTVSDNDTIQYQWYSMEGNKEKKLEGATESSYMISQTTGAGKYQYFCRIRSKDNKDATNMSDTVDSNIATIEIYKAKPLKENFTFSISDEYYYTAQTQTISLQLKSGIVGMGDARIIFKDTNNVNTDFKAAGTYKAFLQVDEGDNYSSDTIDLEKNVTIKKISSPEASSIKTGGSSGKKVGDVYWYNSNVTLSHNDYTISDTESNFTSKLTISDEGKNVGPTRVYLKNKKGFVTDAIELTDKINIDKSVPNVNFSMTGTLINSKNSVEYYKGTLNGSITANDAYSGVNSSSIYFYYATEPKVPEKISGWKAGKEFSITADGIYYFYAKVADQVGNVAYVSYGNDTKVVVDATLPKIECYNNADTPVEITDAKEYYADEKRFVVTDTNLKSVTVNTTSAVEVKDGKAEFVLKSPETVDGSESYTIVATDYTGNEKTLVVTMKNPVVEVSVENVSFGEVVYGYTNIAPKAIVVTPKVEGAPVVIDKVTAVGDAFEVIKGDTGYSVRPKDALAAGVYDFSNNFIRIYYNGDSTAVCRCAFTVKKKELKVTYDNVNHKVYYHTKPTSADFAPYVKVEGFEYSETAATAKGYVAPYIADFTERAVESTYSVQTEGGEAANYTFTHGGTSTVTVERRTLQDGYEISGLKGIGDWYRSDIVFAPKAGYKISQTEDEASFGTDSFSYSTEGESVTKEFYIMNAETGEISVKMSETFMLDKSMPFLSNGQGITVSMNLWTSFLNTITFDMFYNDTKSVSISGSDFVSGIGDIYYYISSNALTETEVNALPDTSWKVYDSSLAISPAELEKVVIYAKIADKAGNALFISSDGMTFDNKQPLVKDVAEGQEYTTEIKEIVVNDNNLQKVVLFEGEKISGEGEIKFVEGTAGTECTFSIPAPEKGSKTYTIFAIDKAGNMIDPTFTVTRPIYDIKATPIVMESVTYGYTSVAAVPVNYENTANANADATISSVVLSNNNNFQVIIKDGKYYIQPRYGLGAGEYKTDVTLTYNGGKTATSTCLFTVNKATLTAGYAGQDVYYNTTPDFTGKLTITGFVGKENASTAVGYKAPILDFDGKAKETVLLKPSGGKAANYQFVYRGGVLVVNRRTAYEGAGKQYVVKGTMSGTGWYLSDITITPNEGYELAVNVAGTDVREKMEITKDAADGVQCFYILNKKTGEMYRETIFTYKKDIVEPKINNVKDGNTYTVNAKQIVVEDDNLSSVTVNGTAQQVTNGTSAFTLQAENKNNIFVIVAADRAGHISEKTLILKQPDSVIDDSDVAKDTGVDNTVVNPKEKDPTYTIITEDETEDDSEDDIQEEGTTEDFEENPGEEIEENLEEETEDLGTVGKEVQLYPGAPNTVLTTGVTKLAASVLTAGEKNAVNKGSDADIALRVKNINDSVSQRDKELVIASLGGYTIGEYFDITLWKTIGSSKEKKVTTTKNPISVTITIPESLRNSNTGKVRDFAILRVHNGKVSVLTDQDKAKNTVTISTDRFSTYVLAYRDTRRSGDSGNGSDGEKSSGFISVFGPDMGDHAPLIPIAIVMVLAIAGIVVVLVVKKRKTNSEE